MSPRHLKPVYFILEGVNSFAATYFFYYLFFHLRDHFGFGSAGNLAVCALHGLIYTAGAWYGGRFAQRAGYFTALRLGFGVMALAALLTGLTGSLALLVGGLALWTFGVCFTWPALEALVSEGEPAACLPRMIGIYNLVWAGGAALAYFVGGALLKVLGPASLFWLPALLHALQLGALFWLKRHRPALTGRAEVFPEARKEPLPPGVVGPELSPKAFLVLAWVANPFAYVAMNAAVPVIPQLAERLHLSTMEAGFFCSIWFFARLATFALLWRWTAWHYRFGWLLAASVLTLGSFAAMFLVEQVLVIAAAQVVFGFGVGLIYYSSLFYSMDAGEAKGEHGGVHESAIGSGVFAGAGLGAAGQYLVGGQHGSTWVVSGVLLLGVALLLGLRVRFGARRRPPRGSDFS